MSEAGKSAFITGGASGIGKAVAQMLFEKGVNVYIADYNTVAAEVFADKLNEAGKAQAAFAHVDVSDWNELVKAFDQAIAAFGKIDYVYPIAGIGERKWMTNNPKSHGWEAPDLSTLDIDLKAVLNTCSLAIQHFRRQELNEQGFRGKIFCVSSVCGFYAVPTLPIYTAAKYGVTGFVRSYGAHLPAEGITLNAICPNVVKTAISSSDFYDKCEVKDLLTPMQSLLDIFNSLLGEDARSGQIFEVGPRGVQTRDAPEPMDVDTEILMDMLKERGKVLHSVTQ
ncbi:hypothetical protein E2P81_ATG10015 [Venturia nashicola]|uniref:NAD(P)-binding protein n=1 Tax=Venturia nashicola TaxID=86259 RepID=A0A4Z1NWS2_9PEZI|nr:hypothetical protein E6O75_ATG10236 [Venturia nashicola]TLD14834.1 hypothetical protein E2P81_ATG10015 [Venturia nashicola]